MAKELLSHALLHDLRGNLTALLGWHSLLGEQEGPAYGGLERSIASLEANVALYSGVRSPECAHDHVRVSELAARVEIDSTGLDPFVIVDADRFEAASALAGLTGLRVLSVDASFVEIELHGCSEAGIRLLQSPHSEALVEAFGARSSVLGVCLFKEVVRGVRGDYVCKDDTGILCIGLPRGKSE